MSNADIDRKEKFLKLCMQFCVDQGMSFPDFLSFHTEIYVDMCTGIKMKRETFKATTEMMLELFDIIENHPS